MDASGAHVLALSTGMIDGLEWSCHYLTHHISVSKGKSPRWFRSTAHVSNNRSVVMPSEQVIFDVQGVFWVSAASPKYSSIKTKSIFSQANNFISILGLN